MFMNIFSEFNLKERKRFEKIDCRLIPETIQKSPHDFINFVTESDLKLVQFSHCVWMKTMQCIWNFLCNTCTYFYIFCRLAILSNNHHISGSRIPHIFGLEKKRHVLLTAQLTKPNENQKVAFGPDVCADYK